VAHVALRSPSAGVAWPFAASESAAAARPLVDGTETSPRANPGAVNADTAGTRKSSPKPIALGIFLTMDVDGSWPCVQVLFI
jgi:hypothetical protein